MTKSMFSNGSEYDAFQDSNCFECQHYVHFEDATEGNPVCDVEERIVLASFGAEELFPFEWLDSNENISRFDCRKKNGLNSET